MPGGSLEKGDAYAIDRQPAAHSHDEFNEMIRDRAEIWGRCDPSGDLTWISVCDKGCARRTSDPICPDGVPWHSRPEHETVRSTTEVTVRLEMSIRPEGVTEIDFAIGTGSCLPGDPHRRYRRPRGEAHSPRHPRLPGARAGARGVAATALGRSPRRRAPASSDLRCRAAPPRTRRLPRRARSR